MPSNLATSKRLDSDVENLLLAGAPIKDVVQQTGLKKSLVYRLKKNLEVYGTVRAPKLPTGGWRSLTPEAYDV